MLDVASALTRNIPAARGINLKWHLVRRIVVVAGLCFLAGAAFAVYRAADDARAQNTAIAEAVARQLEVQLFRIDSALDIAERFPDWDAVVSYGLAAGQCVQFANEGGSPLNSSCAGADNRMIPAPGWFASLYRMAFDGTTQAVRAVTFRGKSRGKIIASSDPVTVAARAWAAISPLLGLSAVLMSALCILVYGVIARALKPAQEILAGLNRVAGGDLTSRLPSFQLEELNRISEVFNDLTSKLQATTIERTELARRLVDAQEHERRHIARELHDEIAQRLSGISALAASIKASAHSASPDVIEEAGDLEKQAAGLMKSVRRTLTSLRPQEIDDLGLVPSLLALIADHNASAKGATRFTLDVKGSFDGLSAETRAHVYRIVQEGLTNAAKHAQARTVAVTLRATGISDANSPSSGGMIMLDVIDDGSVVNDSRSGESGGIGLIGMRERVLALNGRLDAGRRGGGGFGLHAEFPYQPQAGVAE